VFYVLYFAIDLMIFSQRPRLSQIVDAIYARCYDDWRDSTLHADYFAKVGKPPRQAFDLFLLIHASTIGWLSMNFSGAKNIVHEKLVSTMWDRVDRDELRKEKPVSFTAWTMQRQET
jgi:hypothetical protein